MTTSSPALAIRIAKAGAKLQMAAVDAPVSGGDIGAKNGTLSTMCGGEEEVFDAYCTGYIGIWKTVVYQGLAGSAACGNVQSNCHCDEYDCVCEALAYAEKAGLDIETVLKSVSTGAAGSWSLSDLAPQMLDGDLNRDSMLTFHERYNYCADRS